MGDCHSLLPSRSAFVWFSTAALALAAVALPSVVTSNWPSPQPEEVTARSLQPVAMPPHAQREIPGLLWRLNNPSPHLIASDRANPAPTADKFSARVRALEDRALLRAFDGAPPMIPHAITGLHVQSCMACHANGLVTGGRSARMISHTKMTNCTQCHVAAGETFSVPVRAPENTFVGLRSSGYGGTRAWAGAPPVMPHTTFMRTNCVSCHGEYGLAGWRPDHLSRTNCIQCHATAAQFTQLAPTFGVADQADGR